MLKEHENFEEKDRYRIIEMAWEDSSPFEAIQFQFGLSKKEVIEYIRLNGRTTKHQNLREKGINRFKCTMQRAISMNKIEKNIHFMLF